MNSFSNFYYILILQIFLNEKKDWSFARKNLQHLKAIIIKGRLGRNKKIFHINPLVFPLVFPIDNSLVN